MNPTCLRFALRCLLPLTFAFASGAAYAANWTAPTPEELSMTSQPQVPGAAAVYLFREEITDDDVHSWSKYVRLKVLTEKGKEYANVQLRQYQTSDGGGYTVDNIEGRTIHADGSIVPFTGKPFEKLIEETQGFKAMAKVFTLPDVQVGSILEYRYKIHYDEYVYAAPSWYVQSDLYTRKGHYLWRPTDKQLISMNDRGEQVTSSIAWTPILPKEFTVKRGTLLDLAVHDIPPAPTEEYMPPVESLTYRVLFYYTAYNSVDEFWKNEGRAWAKNEDRYIGPGPKVVAAAKEFADGAKSDDEKLRRIYAAVMKLDNTSFTRTRSTAEEKVQGLAPAKSTDDILDRKRGTGTQLALLFIALARASGMKAYAMAVTDRDRALFLPGYLSFSQLDNVIAIVSVDGKEQYFDPGERYAAYGRLAWMHTRVQGLRQVEGGSALGSTPGEATAASRIQRFANLTLDGRGEAAGTVKMTYVGQPALHWRQISLEGDETSLRNSLRNSVERLLPKGMEVKVASIANLEDYEKPLVVSFDVKGVAASSTGKRLVLPADLFEANSTSVFAHEKRELPVYFPYPSMTQDLVHIAFPAGLSVESIPGKDNLDFHQSIGYALLTESTATGFTVRRELAVGNVIYPASDYADLRAFYNKFETRDQESTVLKTNGSPAGN